MPPRPTFATPQERRDYVRSRRDEGLGFAAIGEALGVSASRASQIYHETVRLSEGPPVVPFDDVRIETPFDRLPLSRRVRQVMHHSNFETLGDLLAFDRAELCPLFLRMPNGNRQGWNELAAFLDAFEKGNA
jgi:hypothetical protein